MLYNCDVLVFSHVMDGVKPRLLIRREFESMCRLTSFCVSHWPSRFLRDGFFASSIVNLFRSLILTFYVFSHLLGFKSFHARKGGF